MKNPWKKISSREIYRNPWIRLREDKVISPNGSDTIYGVVEAYPAIAIVPVTETLDTYLVGQYRYPLNTYSWEIPEGGGAEGERPLDTAVRELKEETGLSAKKWTYLDSLYTSNAFTDEVGHVFLAEELIEGNPEPDHSEDLTIRRIPFKEAYNMVLNYTIKDALAIIGILRAHQYLKNQGRIPA
jgi:8-oxo-dGTP pyrophosphatase MutT (NUDIX family)